MTIFSFHPVKIITTGEGGIITTNSSELYQLLIRLRSHGITRDPVLMDGDSHGAWYYQQIELGFNYRMTDMQATLGTSQMSRLDEFAIRRHEIARRYNQLLSGLPLILPWQSPDGYSAFHLYVVRIDPAKTTISRRTLFDELRNANIGVNVHYIPVHTQSYYRRLGFTNGMFPEAESYHAETISLPMFSAMTVIQQDRVVGVINEIFDHVK